MKRRTYIDLGFTAGAFLLSGTLAVAGTAPASKTAHPRNASAIAVDHAGGNGVRRTAGGQAGADVQKTGVNPLYESKDKADLKPTAGASLVQPYKDPEDMTARYRPGNNKTTLHDNKTRGSAAASSH